MSIRPGVVYLDFYKGIYSMPTKREIVRNPLERFREVFTELSAPKGGLPTMPIKVADLASDE